METFVLIALLAAIGAIGWHLNAPNDNTNIPSLIGHMISGALFALIVIYMFIGTVGMVTEKVLVLAFVAGWIGAEGVETAISLVVKQHFPHFIEELE